MEYEKDASAFVFIALERSDLLLRGLVLTYIMDG